MKRSTSSDAQAAVNGLLDVQCFPFFNFAFLILLAALLAPVSTGRAEEFGDIAVEPGAIYSGSTFHGYAEMRVTLENRSFSRTHNVTLVFPNRAWNNGNSIDRLSRTVTLAPGARAVVPLLQPPLPANGDGSIRVEVDHREAGTVRAPNAQQSHGGIQPEAASPSCSSAAAWIPRRWNAVFNAHRGGFTAAMAIGEADANRGRKYEEATWMPDTRHPGATNWLELDYATPFPIEKIQIYNANFRFRRRNLFGRTFLEQTSCAVPMSSGKTSSGGFGGTWITEFSFPLTSQPVKTVRLNFGRITPSGIAIDAVQISGPSGSAWASDARASSDNSASGRILRPQRIAKTIPPKACGRNRPFPPGARTGWHTRRSMPWC